MAKYFERRDLIVMEKNWTCEAGTVDIIAQTENEIVFVEVLTCINAGFGFPDEAVTPWKRARFERIAAAYLKDCKPFDVPIRFDIVGVLVLGVDRAFIKHHINAFANQ